MRPFDRAPREGPAEGEPSGGGAKPAHEDAADVESFAEASLRRTAEPPPLRLARSDSLDEEIRALHEALGELRRRSRRLGAVDTQRSGWRGRLELAVKGFVRKLILRHLDQQREIDEAAVLVLERLASLAERQNALADANANELAEFAVRTGGRRSSR